MPFGYPAQPDRHVRQAVGDDAVVTVLRPVFPAKLRHGDVLRQDRLADVPVPANAEFGHTKPLATIPIGGEIALTVGPSSSITITAHQPSTASSTHRRGGAPRRRP